MVTQAFHDFVTFVTGDLSKPNTVCARMVIKDALNPDVVSSFNSGFVQYEVNLTYL